MEEEVSYYNVLGLAKKFIQLFSIGINFVTNPIPAITHASTSSNSGNPPIFKAHSHVSCSIKDILKQARLKG